MSFDVAKKYVPNLNPNFEHYSIFTDGKYILGIGGFTFLYAPDYKNDISTETECSKLQDKFTRKIKNLYFFDDHEQSYFQKIGDNRSILMDDRRFDFEISENEKLRYLVDCFYYDDQSHFTIQLLFQNFDDTMNESNNFVKVDSLNFKLFSEDLIGL